MNIEIIHGPNLNRLGLREPEIYGSTTLQQLNDNLVQLGKSLGAHVTTFQSNHEGALIEHIHLLHRQRQGIVINAGSLTHTSIGLRDALLSIETPFIEVHISNVYAREAFRHHSYLADVAKGVICGLGVMSYELALRALAK